MRQGIIILAGAILLLGAVYQTPAEAGCSCEKLMDCMVKEGPPKKDEEKPESKTKRGLPLDGKCDMAKLSKDLPALSSGSGVASAFRSPSQPINHSPSPAQLRFQIQASACRIRRDEASGKMTHEQAETAISAQREHLRSVNEQEATQSDAEIAEGKKQIARDNIETMDKASEKSTRAATTQVETLDLDKSLAEQLKVIDKAISENFGTGRAQDLTGEESSAARGRVTKLIQDLVKKIAEDCEGKKVDITQLLGVLRRAQQLGLATEEQITAIMNCKKRAVVAKLTTANGITYEARGCYNPQGMKDAPEFNAFDPEWVVKVSGQMQALGSATFPDGKSGTWKANGQGGGCQINQSGPAEIVSGMGKCVMKISTVPAQGTCVGHKVSVPGSTVGELPIQVLNQSCPKETPKAKPQGK